MDRFKISLRISGDELDPDEITNLLGVSPRIAYRKGGPWKTPKGTPQIGRTGLWNFGVDDVEKNDFESAISDLLLRIPASPEVFRDIASRYEVALFCGLFLDEYHAGIGISSSVMRLMADRGLCIELDIYSYSGEEEAI